MGGSGLLAGGETGEGTGKGIAPMLTGRGGPRLLDGRRTRSGTPAWRNNADLAGRARARRWAKAAVAMNELRCFFFSEIKEREMNTRACEKTSVFQEKSNTIFF